MDYLTSPLLDVKHGFFTRNGGVSTGAFASLNVKYDVGDLKSNVNYNRKLICQELGQDSKNLVFIKVCHGNKIYEAKSSSPNELSDFDAIVTSQKNLPIGLSVADCLPIIFQDENSTKIGIAHAGWRGLLNGVIENTINHMGKSNLRAVIGPSISPSYYEVQSDVASLFSAKYIINQNGKTYLDMWKSAEDQLSNLGVKWDNLKIDTFTDTRFFSYRRENAHTGRFMAIACL